MRADCCRNEAAQGRVGGRQCACSCRRAASDIGGTQVCIKFAVWISRVASEMMATQTLALLVIVSSQNHSISEKQFRNVGDRLGDT